MKQFRNITTIIFDFGGVIINLDLQQCVENMRNLGFGDVDKYLSNFGQSDFFLKFEKGQIGVDEFRTEVRKWTKKTVTDEQIDAAWCSFLKDIPNEKLELLAKLKPNYRLLLLSNTNPLHMELVAPKEFAKHGKTIHDYFDTVYLSYEMKMAKPDVEIFEAVLQDAHLKPEECLFLDDGIKNIETATRLGIQTYLVDVTENLDFLLSI